MLSEAFMSWGFLYNRGASWRSIKCNDFHFRFVYIYRWLEMSTSLWIVMLFFLPFLITNMLSKSGWPHICGVAKVIMPQVFPTVAQVIVLRIYDFNRKNGTLFHPTLLPWPCQTQDIPDFMILYSFKYVLIYPFVLVWEKRVSGNPLTSNL